MTSVTSHLWGSNMNTWQLHEAKAKLTEFVNNAKKEPQIISKHGKPEIVAMDIALYRKLTSKQIDLVSLFKKSPLYGLDFALERDKSQPRDIEL